MMGLGSGNQAARQVARIPNRLILAELPDMVVTTWRL